MRNTINTISLLLLFLLLTQCKQDKKHINENLIEEKEILNFPIQVYFKDTITQLSKNRLDNSFRFLNREFNRIDVNFTIDKLESKPFPYLQDLREDNYAHYLELSKLYDNKDTISLWVVNNDQDRICEIDDVLVRCTKTGGFAFIANPMSNNIVMVNFDLSNPHILAHEFGHFFGLYHTFESQRFGRELPDGSVEIRDDYNRIIDKIPSDKKNCERFGDKVCDTPPDPSTAFEIFVSYNDCEMFYKDWKPMVNNIMAYYKPCIHKPYTFTAGQLQRIKNIGVQFHRHKADTICIKKEKNILYF